MPIVTRELKPISPRPDGTVHVRENVVDRLGRRAVHGPYIAPDEATAVAQMLARDWTPKLKEDDFSDLLVWTQAKNDPGAFDLTDRDITLIEGEDFLYKHFAESSEGSAIKIAWWLKGPLLTPPKFNVIRDRVGHDVDEGDRVKDKAVAQDDAEATINDIVEVNV